MTTARVRAGLRSLGRFLARWGAVFAFVAGGGASVCPCCGSQACSVGFAGAGVVGFLVTALAYLPRRFTGLMRRRVLTTGAPRPACHAHSSE